jgi:hypothetical protein
LQDKKIKTAIDELCDRAYAMSEEEGGLDDLEVEGFLTYVTLEMNHRMGNLTDSEFYEGSRNLLNKAAADQVVTLTVEDGGKTKRHYPAAYNMNTGVVTPEGTVRAGLLDRFSITHVDRGMSFTYKCERKNGKIVVPKKYRRR